MSIKITHGLNEELSGQVDRFLRLYKRYVQAIEKRRVLVITGGQININLPKEIDTMSYTVPRDHADEPYTLDAIVITDSEGTVDAPFTESFTSDNTDVVSIDEAASSFHFGTFGGATCTRKIVLDGNEFVVASVVFNVTPGALTVSGGGVSVPGLTPDA